MGRDLDPVLPWDEGCPAEARRRIGAAADRIDSIHAVSRVVEVGIVGARRRKAPVGRGCPQGTVDLRREPGCRGRDGELTGGLDRQRGRDAGPLAEPAVGLEPIPMEYLSGADRPPHVAEERGERTGRAARIPSSRRLLDGSRRAQRRARTWRRETPRSGDASLGRTQEPCPASSAGPGWVSARQTGSFPDLAITPELDPKTAPRERARRAPGREREGAPE
jgi:hypothetical protein